MQHAIFRPIAVIILLLSGILSTQAVPAYPRPLSLRQPDGTLVCVNLRGDENNHWMETSDGFTLVRNAEGFICFAQLDKDGTLTASTLRYAGSSAEAKTMGLSPNVRLQATSTSKTIKRESLHKSPEAEGLTIDATFPTTGKRKLLVLLVNFSDTKTTYTPANFRSMMNDANYGGVGSFRDYYLQQSYGKLDIDVTVTDWITLPKPKGTYGSEGAAYIIEDALLMVTDTLDLSQFDNDGDGVLDGLAVIHQGFGQEMSADVNDIWSHSAVIYGQKYNGISVRRYTIEPEMLATGNRMSTIGVICHEFGHNLGAPDFYDTDYSSSGGEFCGTGVWDLLGSGAWNGNYGTHPAGINPFQKWVWGWSDPVVLENDATITDMPAADTAPVAYRMETGTPGEYLLFENRQQSGTFDAALPGHGLLAYHVNESIIRSKLSSNDINATYPQGLYTVCADAGAEPDSQTSSFGDINSGGATYPGLYNHTELSDATYPSTRSQNGRYAYRSIENISESNGLISFDFRHHAEPAKPSSLTALAQRGNVILTWDIAAEDEATQPTHYNIYRSDELIGSSTTPTFTDEAAPGGSLLTYEVDAAYADNLLSHPASTQIMVPASNVANFTATEQNEQVVLTWKTDNVLSRVDLTAEQTLLQQDVYADEVEYANCYTPSDLVTYVGATVKRIGFVPLQGPSVLGVKVRVWEGDADGHDAQIVSERTVKEFANGQLRDVLLTTPVTIKADKTYWFSVACISTNGTVSVPCSQADIIPSRGNSMLTNGTFAAYSDAYGNFLVRATLDVANAVATSSDTPAIPSECNPTTDLYYPLAYAIYADGQLIATTSGHRYTMPTLTAGIHTFGISSLFAGGSESTVTTAELTTTAIQSATTTNAMPIVRALEGKIQVEGYNTSVTIFDATGRALATQSLNGQAEWNLAPGTYLVRITRGAETETQKVVVR